MKISSKKGEGRFLAVCILLLMLLLTGCSKKMGEGSTGETQVTGSAVEDTGESCRLSNESDCSPIEIRRGTENESNSSPAENAPNATAAATAQLPDCDAGWKCVERNYRAYQNSSCSWVSVEYCIYGCNNGTCSAAPICKPHSLKCDRDNLMECSQDGYGWELNESCDFECLDGACIGKNDTVQINTTNSNNTTNLTNGTNSTNTMQAHDFIADNCISVPNFNYAPVGNNLSQEYFTLKNLCSYSIDISGWTAKDNQNHVFTFPIFNLDINAELSVHTGNGTNTSTDLYFRKSSAVWNNDRDTLYLNSSNGTSVLIYSYP